jgi:hypothetical protein
MSVELYLDYVDDVLSRTPSVGQHVDYPLIDELVLLWYESFASMAMGKAIRRRILTKLGLTHKRDFKKFVQSYDAERLEYYAEKGNWTEVMDAIRRGGRNWQAALFKTIATKNKPMTAFFLKLYVANSYGALLSAAAETGDFDFFEFFVDLLKKPKYKIEPKPGFKLAQPEIFYNFVSDHPWEEVIEKYSDWINFEPVKYDHFAYDLRTATEGAVSSDNVDIFKYVIGDSDDYDYFFDLAIDDGSLNIAKYVLTKSAINLNKRLVESSGDGNLALVKMLVELGATHISRAFVKAVLSWQFDVADYLFAYLDKSILPKLRERVTDSQMKAYLRDK